MRFFLVVRIRVRQLHTCRTHTPPMVVHSKKYVRRQGAAVLLLCSDHLHPPENRGRLTGCVKKSAQPFFLRTASSRRIMCNVFFLWLKCVVADDDDGGDSL